MHYETWGRKPPFMLALEYLAQVFERYGTFVTIATKALGEQMPVTELSRTTVTGQRYNRHRCHLLPPIPEAAQTLAHFLQVLLPILFFVDATLLVRVKKKSVGGKKWFAAFNRNIQKWNVYSRSTSPLGYLNRVYLHTPPFFFLLP